MVSARVKRVVSGAALAALLLSGCADVDSTWEAPTAPLPPSWTWTWDPGCREPAAGTFRLTFSLDESFRLPHGGQAVRVAVIRTADRATVAAGGGEISTSRSPSFTFAPGAVLGAGGRHEIRYWIDSDAGGRRGECDPRDVDHQGSVELPGVCNDKVIVVSHSDALTEDVCGTFDSRLAPAVPM
jgi:hypothetical protein